MNTNGPRNPLSNFSFHACSYRDDDYDDDDYDDDGDDTEIIYLIEYQLVNPS